MSTGYSLLTEMAKAPTGPDLSNYTVHYIHILGSIAAATRSITKKIIHTEQVASHTVNTSVLPWCTIKNSVRGYLSLSHRTVLVFIPQSGERFNTTDNTGDTENPTCQ
jgi:hypothetical protein